MTRIALIDSLRTDKPNPVEYLHDFVEVLELRRTGV